MTITKIQNIKNLLDHAEEIQMKFPDLKGPMLKL